MCYLGNSINQDSIASKITINTTYRYLHDWHGNSTITMATALPWKQCKCMAKHADRYTVYTLMAKVVVYSDHVIFKHHCI